MPVHFQAMRTSSSSILSRVFFGAMAVAGVVLAAIAAEPGGNSPSSPLALSCRGCHSPAVDAVEMPALDRWGHARIASALRDARDDPRPGSIMARFAAGLSDADIERIAAETSSLP